MECWKPGWGAEPACLTSPLNTGLVRDPYGEAWVGHFGVAEGDGGMG